MMVAIPLIWIVLFGYAATFDVEDIRAAVAIPEDSPNATLVATALNSSGRFDVVESGPLTDAELEAGEPIKKSYCGDCDKCVSHCPARAISGETWKHGMKREIIYDAFACCDNAKELSEKIGVPSTICGICINVCPWTQQYISRQKID